MRHESRSQRNRPVIRVVLTIATVLIVGVVAFLGVRSGSSSVKLKSAEVSSPFAVNSNAAASQYGGGGTTTTGGGTGTTTTGGGTGTTPGSGTGTTTIGLTTTVGIGSGNGHPNGGTSSPSGTGLPAASPPHVSANGGTPAANNAGSNPNSGNAAANGAGNGSGNGATATTCGAAPYSVQTAQGFTFANGVSGDPGMYGDTTGGANGVSGIAGPDVATAWAKDAASGSQHVFNNSVTAGSRGVMWNVPVTGGTYVSFCHFWAVDPWGRWGFELACHQSVPCHDVAAAYASDPAVENKSVAVTPHATFTIPAGKLALVHLTLNHTGGQMLTSGTGQLKGLIRVRSLTAHGQSQPVSGTRSFHIYYVRCVVWGAPQAASTSLEAAFPKSKIGSTYRTKGLNKLRANWVRGGITSSCSHS